MGLKPRSTSKISPKSEGRAAGRKAELLYYGLHICETLGRVRRDEIIRVYCTEELLPGFSELLRWCATQRKAYHVVSAADLEKISGSVHHEGVAILAKAPQHGDSMALQKHLEERSAPLIFLDGVQNPHNIGTIMRVMAHFGWTAVAGHSHLAPLSAAAARMSEGGAEFVQTYALNDAPSFLSELRRKGYRIVGTSSHAKVSLYDKPMTKKVCLVMGHEVHGVSAAIETLFDDVIVIPGTGAVESLNVAVATGLMLGEYARVQGIPGSSASNLKS